MLSLKDFSNRKFKSVVLGEICILYYQEMVATNMKTYPTTDPSLFLIFISPALFCAFILFTDCFDYP